MAFVDMSSSNPFPSEPLEIPPIFTQAPPISQVILLPFSDQTSGKQPALEGQSQAENPKDKAETERMKEKVIEAAKKSKAKKREEGVKGQWWPCELSEPDLKDLESEGFIKAGSWRVITGAPIPAPDDDERVVTKALIERGFSFPPSDFFVKLLKEYRLQPHNIPPNSITAISNFVALCEGHLKIRPELDLFKFYYSVKKESVAKGGPLANCGSVTFKIRANKMYPVLNHHESARYWSGGFFYCKDEKAPGREQGLPVFKDGPPKEINFWNTVPVLSEHPRLNLMVRRIAKLVESGLSGKDLTLSWFSRRIQPLQHRERLMCNYMGRADPLRITQDNLPSDALDKRLRQMIKIPKEVHTHVCAHDIYTKGEGPLVSEIPT